MKVELWIANLSEMAEADPELLSRDEKKRLEKFIYPKHRDLFIKRRVLLRKLAGEYLGIQPKKVGFGYGKLGKPFIAMSTEKLYFNASHSRDHAIVGFSREGHLGVDIEFLDPEIEAELISSHFFAPEEILAIRNSAAEDHADVFFRHWCIKEAYIKFVGKGLTMPLDQVLVRDPRDNPYLEIISTAKRKTKVIRTVRYLDTVPNFGIGVLVDAEDLDVQLKRI